jgi:ceramide glucosyltransferase
MLHWIFFGLAALSLFIGAWQFIAALRIPLHRRRAAPASLPAITLLKPLKGCDEETERCLASWLTQDFPAPLQILFGVASPDDPVCELARRLIVQHPQRDAQLIICRESLGANAKVSSLAQLERLAQHDVIVVSDADVFVPPDFLAQAATKLVEKSAGLVNCFYRLANPVNLAMQWEAVAVNADFWSQVAQSLTLKPMDFALGAVMMTRRENLREIGGFLSLVNHLADDYQLGHRIARCGHPLALCNVVVDCRSGPMHWPEVWSHQLRWARTIRICQPAPYFFSILSNATIWPLLWLAHAGLATPSPRFALAGFAVCIVFRVVAAHVLMRRLAGAAKEIPPAWLAPAKDILSFVIWALAFTGNHVVWRGTRYRVQRDGVLVPEAK